MRPSVLRVVGGAVGAPLALYAASASAELPRHDTVVGTEVTAVDVGTGARERLEGVQHLPWSSLGGDVPAGLRWVTFSVRAGVEAVLVPVCAGRKAVFLDESAVAAGSAGPLVVDVARDGREHRVSILLDIGGYEHRVACGAPPIGGVRAPTTQGLSEIDVETPASARAKDGGHAVVYIPPGHDAQHPSPLLVGLHPWNGGVWTYAAYSALLEAARENDVVLLFPSGLGNSLYTADAEDEVLRAIDALERQVAIDRDRVTLWGASMGGAGATTIGFHHPDLFAQIVSLFGDSRYDLTTYVRGILRDANGAHRVNALDIVDNARNVPVWLIHGADDRVSPLAQSAMLDRALRAKHFAVRFDTVPHAGHEGRVVSAFAARIVAAAAHAQRTLAPPRVSYWGVRQRDRGAYGIRLGRSGGDTFFDLVRRKDGVHLVRAEGITTLRLPRGAFGLAPTETPPVIIDDSSSRGVSIAWDALP